MNERRAISTPPPQEVLFGTNTPGELLMLTEEIILKDHGYDPDLFELVTSTTNTWGFEEHQAHQTKITVRKKVLDDLVLPAAVKGKSFRASRALPKLKTYTVAFLSDQHVPFADSDLHQKVLDWLSEVQPSRVVLLGDLMDFDVISRHQKEPDMSATLQGTVDGAYELLREYREACPAAQFDFLTGNHDERLKKYILNQASDLYGLKQAGGSQDVFSLAHLLRFKELQIRPVAYNGSYVNAEIEVVPGLIAVHGQYVRSATGASVVEHLKRSGKSTVMGHCHRLGQVYVPSYATSTNTLVGVESGYLSSPALGHYAGRYPTWTQGFSYAEISPKTDAFRLATVPYIGGQLLW